MSSTKLAFIETFSKGMGHLKAGQDKVVATVPVNLAKWSIFALNFYFTFYSIYILVISGQTLFINLKNGAGLAKDLSFYFVLFIGLLLFAAFVLAIFAIFRENPDLIRAYFILLAVCLVLQIGMDVSFRIQEAKLTRSYVEDDILVNFEYLSKEKQDQVQTVQQKVANFLITNF